MLEEKLYFRSPFVSQSEIVVSRDHMQPVQFLGFSKDLFQNFNYNKISCSLFVRGHCSSLLSKFNLRHSNRTMLLFYYGPEK